jgi:hypothetical protein
MVDPADQQKDALMYDLLLFLKDCNVARKYRFTGQNNPQHQ